MKNLKNNKAITLIALIITVIVMMILAGVTVYLAFNEGGLIEKVKQTSIIQELKEVEEQVMLKIEEERLNKFSNNEKFNISDYTSLESFSPKIESKYSEYIRIENGKMYIKTNAPEEVKKVAEKIGIQIKDRINNIRIYGNSIQNGIPSPENPVEIQSVGDLVTDKNDPNYGKYKIPIKVSGKNLFDTSKINVESYGASVIGEEININNTGYQFSYVRLPISLENNKQYTLSLKTKDFNSDYTGNIRQTVVTYLNGTIQEAFDSNSVLASSNMEHTGTFSLTKEFDTLEIRVNRCTEKGFVSTATIYNIQLEEGDTATAYEPYIEPVTTNIYLDEPLRKVGDNADYIDFSTGEVIRVVKEKIFTGKDDIWISWPESMTEKSIGVYYRNEQELGIYQFPKIKRLLGLCTQFKNLDIAVYTPNDSIIGTMLINATANPPYLGFKVPFTNLNDWKAYLATQYSSGNPVTVHYVLINPEKTTISLPNISTLSGMKNVSVETPIQPSKIDVVM